jgi:hypothetical protein
LCTLGREVAACKAGHGRSQDVPCPIHGPALCMRFAQYTVQPCAHWAACKAVQMLSPDRRVAPPESKEASKSIEAPLNIIKQIIADTSKVQHLFLKTLTSSYDGKMSLDI